jgi:hypothetical protein
VILAVRPGTESHANLMVHLRTEPLASEWWADAESEADDDASYVVVYAAGRVPTAWAGFKVEGGVLRCVDNYERRGYRGRGLYECAYRWRHERVVVPLQLPAETYLFPEPIALHEADGWVRDPGCSGVSTVTGVEHHWQRLTWAPAG